MMSYLDKVVVVKDTNNTSNPESDLIDSSV